MKSLAAVKRRSVHIVRVFRSGLDPRQGRIVAGPLVLRCALGRAGTIAAKREGDGATPRGHFRMLGAFYRADHVRRPRTGLPLSEIGKKDGWCDDPRDRRYNRPIALPSSARHERMWRDDGVYDLVVDIAYNRGPIGRGRGSAIFLHLARPGFTPTEGCVAVAPSQAARLLERIGRRTLIEIR